MHEWALAEAVVATAVKAAKENKFREVREIEIQLGQLQQIKKDVFEFAIREAIQFQKSLFKKTKIQFRMRKPFFNAELEDAIGNSNKLLKTDFPKAVNQSIVEKMKKHLNKKKVIIRKKKAKA